MSLYTEDIQALGPLPTQEELGITPLYDQVLVEQVKILERHERKVGSLYLPSNAEREMGESMEYCWLGRVVAVGPGDKLIEGEWQIEGWRKRSFRPLYPAPGGRTTLSLSPGHMVLYERRPWAVIERNGKPYVMLHEEQHIRAVIGYEEIFPLADNLVVKQADPFEKSTGGLLFIPATADGEEYLRGTVISVGPGKRTRTGARRPLDVHRGEQIACAKDPRNGSRVFLDGQEFILLKEEDVYGVIQDHQKAA